MKSQELLGRPPRCRCGKIAYDKKSAQTAKNSRYHRDHVELRIYPCPESNRWHLTSHNPDRGKFIKRHKPYN